MFEKLKTALGELRSEHGVIKKKREKLLQRREDLYSLPISKEDFINIMSEGINTHAEEYIKKMQLTVNEFNGRGNGLRTAHQVSTLPVLAPWSGDGNYKILPMAIFALFGEEMKTSLSKVVSNLDWPEAGPPLSARKKEIDNIDKEISKLDTELEKLNTIANQSGVELTGMTIGQKGKKPLPGEVRPR